MLRFEKMAHFLLFATLVALFSPSASAPPDCAASDARLLSLQQLYCSSMGPAINCPLGNHPAAGDWPTQTVYMKNLLLAVVDNSTCLATPTAAAILNWLSVVSTNSTVSMWFWNWLVFQPQYFDMPRLPGERIESPATLGRKCWAFAHLAQLWVTLQPQILAATARAKVNLSAFVRAFNDAVPMSLGLCTRVLANCFLNQSYNPSVNGTCPEAVGQFFVGFQWENGDNNAIGSGLCPIGNCWRNFSVAFPFPRYSQTVEWRESAVFAVNTALNYIV